MEDPKSIAEKFKTECFARGFNFVVGENMVTVTKSFQALSVTAFTQCEFDGETLLSMLPMKYPGSVWGTDGGSVGGWSAIQNGQYRLNKSGISKKVLKELSKL